MSFLQVLVAREDVDSSSPAVGNEGGPGSTSLPSSRRETRSVSVSVKQVCKQHTTVAKILLVTAGLDLSLEVSPSLESDGKAENQSFTLAVTALH